MNTFLNGKKTHLTGALVILLLVGQWAKWWVIPAEVYGVLLSLGLIFLRHGISKAEKKTGKFDWRAESPAADPKPPTSNLSPPTSQ